MFAFLDDDEEVAKLDSTYSIEANALAPSTATATFRLENDGDISKTENLTTTDIGDWNRSRIPDADFETRATLLSGSTPSGTLDTWLALSSSREWTVEQSVAGNTTCDLTIEIRHESGPNILASSTVTLVATVDP